MPDIQNGNCQFLFNLTCTDETGQSSPCEDLTQFQITYPEFTPSNAPCSQCFSLSTYPEIKWQTNDLLDQGLFTVDILLVDGISTVSAQFVLEIFSNSCSLPSNPGSFTAPADNSLDLIK